MKRTRIILVIVSLLVVVLVAYIYGLWLSHEKGKQFSIPDETEPLFPMSVGTVTWKYNNISGFWLEIPIYSDYSVTGDLEIDLVGSGDFVNRTITFEYITVPRIVIVPLETNPQLACRMPESVHVLFTVENEILLSAEVTEIRKG